jgi:D-alanyl-D-alanine carboxypeptidase
MYRRVFVSVLTAVLSLALAVPATAAAVRPADRASTLRQLLEAEHAAGLPGAYAQVRDGGRSWPVAAGVADLGTGRPTQPWFEHRIGSITKTFVATALLQLAGEHRLRLDAPIGDYLPEVVPGDLGRRVTVRMLLQHTSGIGNYTTALLKTEADLERLRYSTFTPRDLVAIGLGLPPTNAPGAAWSYSNTNYIIAGLLLQRLTGHTVAAEVGRRILRPLSLHGTYFPGSDPYIRGPHSKAYVPWPDGTLRDFSVYGMSWAWAAGELISTPQDLNRFFRALLTGRLLRPAQLAQMQTTVPMDPARPDLGGYGLGLYSVALPCGRYWGHDGGVVGQSTFSFHSPDGTRQVSLGENLTFYPAPGPIDEARGNFLVEALCGPGTASRVTAAARPGSLPMPSGLTLSRG